ncbi:MAG TPA: L-threonylcarbamoyladenylate synthase [Pyrinomonadaceae bacterium]|nr:L-threonylcarbamoyladenylate synthase [Pyrinomonadaceae bacterium]
MIQKDNEQIRIKAAEIVANGGVIAFRTDTFYGLGVDPFNREAIVRVRELKGREAAKPILLLISDANELDRFVNNSEFLRMIAVGHWPGPLTLIGGARPEVPVELTAGTGTIGVRLPDDEDARALVRACGGALTATSANPSGQPPARNAKEVENYFREGIDLIIDGGETIATEPSTVLDLSGAKRRLVREGAISRAKLEELLSD